MGTVRYISLAILLLVATLSYAEDDNSTTDIIAIENDTATTEYSLNENISSTLYANETLYDVTETEVDSITIKKTVVKAGGKGGQVKCRDGLLFPVWKPTEHITVGDRFARGTIYFLFMCYLFLGVSIVSDRFMAAIEKITAIEKEVTIHKKDGTKQKVVVRVWNETVANLTLMALGTSAPEILLSIIEIFTQNFEAGDLGPGTIVGSAAYNLFAIIAFCIVVIPNGEVRRIKHLRVFFVTATFSIFAYVWMYLILAYFSPGEVTICEGLITFSFFPMIVSFAYIADRRLLVYKYFGKGYRMNKHGIMIQTESNADVELNGRSYSLKPEEITELLPSEYKDFEQTKRNFIEMLSELRKTYPHYDRETLELMAQEQLLNAGPKSRAFYRIQATRKMLGGGNMIRKMAERTQNEVKADLSVVQVVDDDITPRVFFEPGQYTVMENCGTADIRIVRRGDFSGHVSVDYQTENGSAEAGTDYIDNRGTITFTPGIDERTIKIEIIDDDIFEQDEMFYIRLSNPTNGAILGTPKIATVMILDDDHGGFFQFASKEHELNETIGIYELKVVRLSGARGKVILPYWTEDGTAKAGKAYESLKGELTFDNNETE